MGTVRKTITLTDQQDAWIAAQITTGQYTNDSEAIRDLIRREQERSFEIETIRQALAEAPQQAQSWANIRPGYRRRSVENHIIYFRPTTYGIAV